MALLRCRRSGSIYWTAFLVGAALLVVGCGGDTSERAESSLELQLPAIEASVQLESLPEAQTDGQRISDSTGAISFVGARTWTSRAEGDETFEGEVVGRRLAASTNTELLKSTFAAPGVFIFASRTLGQLLLGEPDAGLAVQQLVQSVKVDVRACGVEVYDFVISKAGDNEYSKVLADIAQTGILSLYPSCDEQKTDFLNFGLLTHDGTYVYGEGTAPTEIDLADVSRALATLEIKGDVLPASDATNTEPTGTTETTDTTAVTDTTTTETTDTTETTETADQP